MTEEHFARILPNGRRVSEPPEKVEVGDIKGTLGGDRPHSGGSDGHRDPEQIHDELVRGFLQRRTLDVAEPVET